MNSFNGLSLPLSIGSIGLLGAIIIIIRSRQASLITPGHKASVDAFMRTTFFKWVTILSTFCGLSWIGEKLYNDLQSQEVRESHSSTVASKDSIEKKLPETTMGKQPDLVLQKGRSHKPRRQGITIISVQNDAYTAQLVTEKLQALFTDIGQQDKLVIQGEVSIRRQDDASGNYLPYTASLTVQCFGPDGIRSCGVTTVTTYGNVNRIKSGASVSNQVVAELIHKLQPQLPACK